jgi:RNA polymerase sigma-70 factor (ECF subfamily)
VTASPAIKDQIAPMRAETPECDDERMRVLYHDYATDLQRFSLRLTQGDHQWAEDVAQETLVRAWRSLDKLLSFGGSLRPWLFTVARRIVIDGRRIRASRPEEAADEIDLLVIPVPDETQHVVDSIILVDALNELAPLHRDVLVEIFYRRLTATEAATVLGIPIGTVKSRVFYGLRALRLALEARQCCG